MLGNVLRPIYVSLQEDEPISFDEANSYWPISLKADDLFDSNFKLIINVGEEMSQNRDIVIVVLYKGVHYLLGIVENVPPNSIVTMTWIEGSEPTIREFIEALGGTITETTTIALTWETGYTIDGGSTFHKTDELPTSIYVEVPGTDWLTIAVVAGIVVGVGAIGYSLLKKPAVTRG